MSNSALSVIYTITFVIEIFFNGILFFLSLRFFWRLCWHNKSTAFKNMVAFYFLAFLFAIRGIILGINSLILGIKISSRGLTFQHIVGTIGGLIFLVSHFRPLYIWLYISSLSSKVPLLSFLEFLVVINYIIFASLMPVFNEAIPVLAFGTAITCILLSIMHGILGSRVSRQLKSKASSETKYQSDTFMDKIDYKRNSGTISNELNQTLINKSENESFQEMNSISIENDDQKNNNNNNNNNLNNHSNSIHSIHDNPNNNNINQNNNQSKLKKKKSLMKRTSKKILQLTYIISIYCGLIGIWFIIRGFHHLSLFQLNPIGQAIFTLVPYILIDLGVIFMSFTMSTTSNSSSSSSSSINNTPSLLKKLLCLA